MNYREVEILADKTVADSGTETIDINVTDPITEMFVDFKVTNEAQVCEDVPAEREISKIEIVDGGKVYWSTAGLEAMAVSTYEKRRWPTVWLYEGSGGNQRAMIPLQFGRYVGDEQFSFNPRALRNPQLKVTWTNNALHATAQTQLGIYAKVMEGVSAAAQALMVKSVRTFTTAAAAVEPTDLPVDRPIRRLFIGGELEQYSITSLISQYKLDCDAGKLVVFDLGYRKMTHRCEADFGFFDYRKHDFLDSSRYVQAWMGRTMAAQGQASAGNITINLYTTSSDRYYVSVYDAAGDPATDVSASVWVYGSFPQNILCYPFGRENDPESWFNPAQYGQVKLELTTPIADAAARILAQQVVPIP